MRYGYLRSSGLDVVALKRLVDHSKYLNVMMRDEKKRQPRRGGRYLISVGVPHNRDKTRACW